jgi:hypothetical protein
MKKIYKYKIPKNGLIELPYNAEILSAGVQNEDIFIWALVDTLTDMSETRVIEVLGTGFTLSYENYKFINTVFINECVFHIFEVY